MIALYGTKYRVYAWIARFSVPGLLPDLELSRPVIAAGMVVRQPLTHTAIADALAFRRNKPMQRALITGSV